MSETEALTIRIGILHPDLGIGGAERLVVDAALGLQKLGHKVQIYTSHHDPAHSFEETRDGSLDVQYIKSPFPRSFLGRFHIVFAILRQLHLVFTLLFGARDGSIPVCDVYVVDQLSTCIPLLRWGLRRRVVFYCHFPDKLLADGNAANTDGKRSGSLLKQLYRYPADWLEEATTRQSDVILANSQFTAGVFRTAFPSIAAVPRVVHPGINIEAYDKPKEEPSDEELGGLKEVLNHPTLLSLNRIERKKNHELAIKTFSHFRAGLSEKEKSQFGRSVRLVIGGGYDERLVDNVETLSHLVSLSESLGLKSYVLSSKPLQKFTVSNETPHIESDITFLLNFSTIQRTSLLRSPQTLALLYTPMNEHFGIGPVEAMICGLPVLASESGGPVESVVPYHATSRTGTGWLLPVSPSSLPSSPTSSSPPSLDGRSDRVDPTVESWSSAVRQATIELSPVERNILSESAQERARTLFGMEVMAKALCHVLREAYGMGLVGAGSSSSGSTPAVKGVRQRAADEVLWMGQVAITGVAILAALLVYLGYL